MNLYAATVPQLRKMLTNLTGWIDEGIAYAKENGQDPDALLEERLAPDQFNLTRQIQAACDNAKGLAARLAERTPPKHADVEKTMPEIRSRVATVIAYLDTFKPADFEGSAERIVPLFFMPGKGLSGADYTTEFALPNFYFHVTSAYSILRHNGVALGKMKYIGSLNLVDA